MSSSAGKRTIQQRTGAQSALAALRAAREGKKRLEQSTNDVCIDIDIYK